MNWGFIPGKEPKPIRFFRQDGQIWAEYLLMHLDNKLEIMATLWEEKFDGPIPNNIVIEDEKDSPKEESKASKENSFEEHKRKEEEGGSRR